MNSPSLSPIPSTLRLPSWLLNASVLLLLTAVSLWLLDGFAIGPLNDGWLGLGLKIQQGHLIRENGTTRVLGSLPRALGTRLTDDSFVGWQLMLLVLSALRALLFYDTVRRLLPGERLFALACGLLALVHPADNAWFWVDATGAHLGLVLALAACWASLAYLRGGGQAWLLATLAFQLAACLTYTAYQPLMFLFPLGAWLLLRLQGAAPSPRRLAAVSVLVPLSMAAQLVLLAHGVGREGRVADLHAHAALAGYASEARLFLTASAHAFAGFKPQYLLYALLPALLAGLLAIQPRPAAPGSPARPAFHALLLLGLLGLAAASYFPYALSDVRFGNKRQLLAAGIFVYAAAAYLLFVMLPPRLARWPKAAWAFPALLTALAAATVCVGLEKRSTFVEMYRLEERLLSQVAAQVPGPKPGTVLLVRLHSRMQGKRIPGFYNRPAALEWALQAMYSDPSLHADFIPMQAAKLKFARDGLVLRQRLPKREGGVQERTVPYGNLIILDYPPRGEASILGPDWLQAGAGKLDVSAYRPQQAMTPQPAPDAVICTLLERRFRPAYCPAR